MYSPENSYVARLITKFKLTRKMVDSEKRSEGKGGVEAFQHFFSGSFVSVPFCPFFFLFRFLYQGYNFSFLTLYPSPTYYVSPVFPVAGLV